MAIDEKKLIEAIYELNASKPNAPLEFVVTLGMVLTLIENQPKISLETKTSDKWIPFDKQLPPKLEDGIYQGYIVQVVNVLEPFTAYWDGEKWLDEWYDKMYGVIAWMPLPEPYKGE